MLIHQPGRAMHGVHGISSSCLEAPESYPPRTRRLVHGRRTRGRHVTRRGAPPPVPPCRTTLSTHTPAPTGHSVQRTPCTSRAPYVRGHGDKPPRTDGAAWVPRTGGEIFSSRQRGSPTRSAVALKVASWWVCWFVGLSVSEADRLEKVPAPWLARSAAGPPRSANHLPRRHPLSLLKQGRGSTAMSPSSRRTGVEVEPTKGYGVASACLLAACL